MQDKFDSESGYLMADVLVVVRSCWLLLEAETFRESGRVASVVGTQNSVLSEPSRKGEAPQRGVRRQTTSPEARPFLVIVIGRRGGRSL